MVAGTESHTGRAPGTDRVHGPAVSAGRGCADTPAIGTAHVILYYVCKGISDSEVSW